MFARKVMCRFLTTSVAQPKTHQAVFLPLAPAFLLVGLLVLVAALISKRVITVGVECVQEIASIAMVSGSVPAIMNLSAQNDGRIVRATRIAAATRWSVVRLWMMPDTRIQVATYPQISTMAQKLQWKWERSRTAASIFSAVSKAMALQ
jgi:hypothetical protein